MPFARKIEVENGILGIWELTESTDSLIAGFRFSDNEEKEFQKYSFKKRQSEYIASRLLVQHLLNKKTEIIYLKSGKPKIKNSTLNISISHSANLVVAFISDDQVGIDVENVDRNIQPVAKRFLHNNEMQWIVKSENIQYLMVLFWGAKESIYKCCNQSGVQFDTQIHIPPFEFGKTDFFTGKLITPKKQENYNLWYFYYQNNIIVYCVEVRNNS